MERDNDWYLDLERPEVLAAELAGMDKPATVSEDAVAMIARLQRAVRKLRGAMSECVVGPCRCGGYGVVYDAENGAAMGLCHSPLSAQDAMQDDMAELLRALGLGDHARPESPHEVMRKEIIPALRAAIARRAETGGEMTDTERLDWLADEMQDVTFGGGDRMDGYELACEIAWERGDEEPTEQDIRAGFRKMIDRAMKDAAAIARATGGENG